MSRTHKEARGTPVTIAAPHAENVHVAGDFNQWNPGTHPLRRARDGRWVGVLDLPPGSHEHKFIVDGRWCCADGRDEPYDGRPGHARNEFGTMNIIVVVRPVRRGGRDWLPRNARSSPVPTPLNSEAELAAHAVL